MVETKNLKYEYYCHLWGGFFNEDNKKIHKYNEGDYYFDTEEERSSFIKKLESYISNLDEYHTLERNLSEGFHVRERATLYRTIKYKDKFYHSEYLWSFANELIFNLIFHLENQWYPGFNDYPLGEDFDYSEIEIIEEGVKGYSITSNEY